MLSRLCLPLALLLLAACSSNALYWDNTPPYVRNQLADADLLMEQGDLSAARERYAQIAETGHPEALISAGRAWLEEPEADNERATSYFETAWNRKSKRRNQAGRYLARTITDDDPERAIDILETVAGRGERYASGQLAKLLIEHHPDDPRIEALLRQAASEGDVTAMLTLARDYGDDQSLKRAVAELETQSAAGSAKAASRLARVYAPKGPSPDNERYLDWLQLAADRGYPSAMLNYGRVLLKGEIVTRDPEQGMRLIRQAAAADSDWAQLELGRRLINGDQTEPDPEKGRMWLERAAAQGNQKAERTLTEL